MQDSITKLAKDFLLSFSTGKLRLSVARYFAADMEQIPFARLGIERVYGGLKERRAVLAPLLTIENLIALVERPYGHENNALVYYERRPDIDNFPFIFAVRLRMAILDLLFSKGWRLRNVRVKVSHIKTWSKAVSRSSAIITVLSKSNEDAIRAVVKLCRSDKIHSAKVIGECETYGYSEEFMERFAPFWRLLEASGWQPGEI